MLCKAFFCSIVWFFSEVTNHGSIKMSTTDLTMYSFVGFVCFSDRQLKGRSLSILQGYHYRNVQPDFSEHLFYLRITRFSRGTIRVLHSSTWIFRVGSHRVNVWFGCTLEFMVISQKISFPNSLGPYK